MCGTMMPTNPISPLTETAAAVPRVAAITTVSRSRAMSTPRLAASVSPTRSTSSSRRWASSTTAATVDVRQDQQHVGPGRQGQAAQDPRVHRLQRLRVLLLQVGLHRGEQRGHRHPGQHDGPGRARPAAARPGARSERVGDRDGQGRARERGGRQQRRAAARDDHDGGAQAAARGHPEQVRVGQRVAEHPLVRGAAAGQHGADDGAQHHPGQPDLPDDGGVDGGHAGHRVPGQLRGQRAGHRGQRQPGRPDPHPEEQRREQHGRRGQQGPPGPGPRDARHGRPGPGRSSGSRPPGRGREGPISPLHARATAVSTVPSRTVTRGPHREAMSSLSAMMCPERTAARLDQPGRFATVAALCWQHSVSARMM